MQRHAVIAAVLIYAAAFGGSLAVRLSMPVEMTATDVGRIMQARVHKIVSVRNTEDIAEALAEAKRKGLKIAVSGTRHSQGGQTMFEGAIVLDMRPYRQVLELDVQRRIIRVQSGATWAQIQERIHPHGLAIRVMQSSNIFTVGGSLSANVHGRDPREGPLIDTVESFRLMTADGRILNVSRTENEELFPLVIGGYGLFGVVLDVDLRLTADEVYAEYTEPLDYNIFPDYFQRNILSSDNVGLAFARLSTAPNSFLKEMYVTRYERTNERLPDDRQGLKEESAVEATKFLFGLSRKFDWGKELSWSLQKRLFSAEPGALISRNNAMRPEIEFLEYRDTQKTDLLQEYFIPTDRFVPFVDQLRDIVRRYRLNLVNITVRYVPENEEAVLSYARGDRFALVLLLNHKTSDTEIHRLEEATRQMVGAAIDHGGSYYLTYQLFPTKDQLLSAYPSAEMFFRLKTKWDPENLFMNEFYARYAS
jgi:FAD/FMN-containing dehydrogenase